MGDVGEWLERLGLSRYRAVFAEHDIDREILPDLTDQDLETLGLSLGHRKKLLRAVAELAQAEGGAQREPQPAPRAAERRQLTVLFCDLVGSTALAARLDPEDLREVMRAYHAACAEVIGRFEGHVAKFLGDGVLAYFGWPQAHEDDAERAVRAGLQLVETIAGLQAHADVGLQARIGIATGQAVVGDLVGEGASREEAVVGEMPNLAARLQALAAPSWVVISQATRRLVGGLFEVDDLGPRRLKGFPEPLAAFRVAGEGRADGRFEARQTAGLTPLVGRDEELGLLLRRWEQAKGGEGQIVLLSGEPGIGKSRLLAAAQERLRDEPHAHLRYFCSTHRQDSPLHPVLAQLERAAGFARGDSPEVRLEKLEALLALASPHTEEVALLAELLSLPLGGRYISPPLSPQGKRERTFVALLHQIERLSDHDPVLMVFEDVHWIDPSSRELLDLAVERLVRLRVLLLVTFRPEFEPPWTDRPCVTALALSRLGRWEAALLAQQVASGAEMPAGLVNEIVERTDGVPLFVEELTKAVLEVGPAGTLAVAPPAALAVPATLHDSLMARLDRLGPTAREAAQLGAVIGREFSHQLLAAVAGLDDSELASALDQLAGAGLVFRRETGPETGYLFKHALVRDAAYGTLLRDRRRRLHTITARTLEEQFPELVEAAPEVLAHHLTEASEVERALRYWLEAGQRAAQRSADREAVSHLRRGLELLAGLPASTERDRAELDIQLALGTPLIALSGWSGPQVAAAYERAGALCERLGDDVRLAPALFGLASNRVVRGETRTALHLAERCRAAAERRRDPVDRLLAHRATGAALMQLGALREARIEFEAIPPLYDPERDRGLAARCVTDPRASALSFLALVLWMMGYPDQARRTAGEASRCAAELGHANTTGHILCHGGGGELAQFLRDVPATGCYAEAVIALAAEHDMPMWRGYGLVLRGWVLAEEGHPGDGVPLVRQGIGELDALGTVFHRSHHIGILAGIHARLGDPAAGLGVLGVARGEVMPTEVQLFEAEIQRLAGELRRLVGTYEAEAEACLAEALAVARRQEAKSFELRAATSLARLWRDQGRRAEAHNLLAPVYGWFTEGFDTADLMEAKGLLDELA
jgi:class 3 adenylate cyclase/predicted ATPase